MRSFQAKTSKTDTLRRESWRRPTETSSFIRVATGASGRDVGDKEKVGLSGPSPGRQVKGDLDGQYYNRKYGQQHRVDLELYLGPSPYTEPSVTQFLLL